MGGVLSGVALTVACASAEGNNNCGAMLAGTAIAWGLVGAPSALAPGKSSQLRVRGPDFEPLRPYARFPQGLPEGLEPGRLAPGEGSSTAP